MSPFKSGARATRRQLYRALCGTIGVQFDDALKALLHEIERRAIAREMRTALLGARDPTIFSDRLSGHETIEVPIVVSADGDDDVDRISERCEAVRYTGQFDFLYGRPRFGIDRIQA